MSDRLHVQPDARDLFGQLGLSGFDSVMAFRSGMTVSQHKHRSTALVLLGEGAGTRRLYLKRVYRALPKHIFEDLAAGRMPCSQPLKEWRAIELCRRRGIAVMRGLAWGERSVMGVPRQAFIFVEAVPAVESLDEAMRRLNGPDPDGRLAAERRALARELGTFVARLHGAGLVWPDMVGKHIYLAPDPSTQDLRWRFFLIDVERLTSGGSRRTRRRDVARLFDSLRCHRLRVTDLLRFADSYLHRGSTRWSEHRARVVNAFRWAGRVIRRSWATRGPRLPMPDDAPTPDERLFTRYGKVIVNTAYVPILQANGLVSFGSVFRHEGGLRLDKANIGSWRQRWRIDLSDPDGTSRTFYLKRYQRPPLTEQLRRMLLQRPRHGSAWWEWHNIQRLGDAGIPTATPVACGEKMRGLVERRSFLVTDAIPGESLERWVPEHLKPGGDVDWRERRALVEQLANFVRMLHRRRLVHRDLYLSHVFISHNKTGRAVFRLIDLQRLFRPRLRWRRWVVKDLAALHYSTPPDCVSVTERLRFMRRYLGVRRFAPKHRRLIRAVLAKARRTQRHNRLR